MHGVLMILRCLALVLLACTVSVALAERDPLNEPAFTTVGDTRSINDGVVTALAQDERGLIWIGTTVGLVRYDGYQLRREVVGGKPVTGTAPKAAPAGSSFVRALLSAPGGVLWVGLDGEGLARLDTERQVWTRHVPNPKVPARDQ
jgi:ligand-binding sensor domain-containing protein